MSGWCHWKRAKYKRPKLGEKRKHIRHPDSLGISFWEAYRIARSRRDDGYADKTVRRHTVLGVLKESVDLGIKLRETWEDPDDEYGEKFELVLEEVNAFMDPIGRSAPHPAGSVAPWKVKK